MCCSVYGRCRLTKVELGEAQSQARYRRCSEYPRHRVQTLPSYESDQEQRKQEVKMFLDRQRPGVRPDMGEIILDKENRTKDSGGNIVPGREKGSGGDEHQQVVGRVNLKPSADPKSHNSDASGLLVLLEEQSRYQKAAQDEEQINTGPSDLPPPMKVAVMESENQQDGDAPKNVEGL